MRKTWACIGFTILAMSTVPPGVSAEDPPAGLSTSEWRQITSAIQLEHGRRTAETGPKNTESLYALDQKLGPEPTIPEARFGNSVAIDGDVAVVGAAWANLAFVFTRETEGWELRQTLEGIWEPGSGCDYESWFFGYSVAIDGPIIAVGAPRYGCYYPNGTAATYGNVLIFEETVPGSWSLTANVLDTLPNLVLFAGSWLGTSVAVSGTTVVTGAARFTFNRGACVVVTKSSGQWTYEELITAPFAAEGDLFGFSVSLLGDTLAASSPNDTVSLSSEAGRVHVFNRSGSSWTHTVDLTASDSATGNHFGTSVSLVSPMLLVGAPDDDHAAGANAGSAYVFTETGGVWSQDQKIVALDGEAGDRFGAAVALGWGVAVIGAPGDNLGDLNIDAGSSYVFKPIVGTWYQDQKIVAPDGENSDHFGWSVGVWGTTALVGSPYDNVPNVTDTGSASFFEWDAGSWVYDGMVLGTREGLQKTFGDSVAVDGDAMVVGVTDDSIFGFATGEAYIFSRVADSWELEWVLSTDEGLRRFGGAVDISGSTVLVGAEDAAIHSGVAIVYTREVGVFGPYWDLQEVLTASDGAEGDRFGADVAIDGDIALIGAPGRDMASVLDCGAVYSFSRSGVVWNEDQLVVTSIPSAEDRFGGSVALAGDVFVAGSSGDDFPSAFDAGAAFVFRRMVDDWIEEQKLLAGTPVSEAFFGHTVAIDGTTVLVGAPGTQVSGHLGAGAAHVFVEEAGDWSEEQQLTAAVPSTDAFFGEAVAVTGGTAVIGSPGRALHPHGRIGSAAVFHRSGPAWNQQQLLVADAPETDARFGRAVAISPDGVVVAAPEEHFTPAHPGAVYWYEGSIVETDLSIAMDDGVTEVVPGNGVSYLTVVTNAGPSEAMGASVSDTFPPGLLSCTWTCVAFGGGVCTPGPVSGYIADTVDLPVSGRLEYTSTCLVDPSATGDLANTASITAPPGVVDTNPLNNTATDLDTLTPVADLSIGKDNAVTQIIEAQTTTYTITVANAGPSDAPAAPVTDTFPPELTGCTWTCTPGAGAACAVAGVGDLNDLADLPAASGVTYLATCTVASSSGQCSNTAAAAEPVGVTDPDPLNNDSTDTDDVIGLADVIFTDGFESENASAWSSTTP